MAHTDIQRRFTGLNAGVRKYDMLTAMALVGLAGPPVLHTSMLRLIAIVTARYNWSLDELTMGQREMARIWQVCMRTAKREVKRMTAASILVPIRPGVRGRVAAYRLNHDEIRRLSRPVWNCIGPDFTSRMAGVAETPAPSSATVVPLHPEHFGLPEEDGSGWRTAAVRLREDDPAVYRSWFAPLRSLGLAGGVLVLEAPTRFHASYVQTHHSPRLLAALLSCGAPVRDVKVTAP